MNQPTPDNSKTTIAARSMLLVLAVGLFIVVWRSDRRTTTDMNNSESNRQVAQSAPPRTATTRSAARPAALTFVTELADLTPPPASASVGQWPVLTSRQDSENWNGPLPGGMTPGDYQVVCSDGKTFPLKVTRRLLQSRGLTSSSIARDSYMLHDGRVRWYFIRIENPAQPVVRTPSVRPAVLVQNLRRRVLSARVIQWFRASVLRFGPMFQQGMQNTVESWQRQVSRSLEFARNWVPRTLRISSGHRAPQR